MKRILLATVALASVATAGAQSTGSFEPEVSVLCMVNGERVTDPDKIAYHIGQALKLASDNLRLPGAVLSTTLTADPAMTKVCEMLNELINNR